MSFLPHTQSNIFSDVESVLPLSNQSQQSNVELLVRNMETQLNNTKDLLNRPDFNTLKRNDPGEQEIRQVRNFITKEKGGEYVTRAWLKMMEMLINTQLGQYILNQPEINAFFNAEFPGAFIYAVHHFAQQHNRKFRWVIASYLPRSKLGQDFLEDHYRLLEKYPSNSLVGEIKTNKGVFWSDGDLTQPRMPAILAQLAKSKLGRINLYTADGGFDVGGRENLQEELSLPLIRGEIETGLLSLSEGGCFVLKIFTFFTPQMRSLLVLLMRLFHQFDIFKPQTSGRLNSESYVIGLGFKGISQEQIVQLRQDPQHAETRYAIITPAEEEFLINKMNGLVENQIIEINSFLTGQYTPMALKWPQQLGRITTHL